MEKLGNELQISKNTVEKYLDLFSKFFIIYSLPGFSKNRDNEITKMNKWYYMDNGIRNAMINQFAPLNQRDDLGLLWENYLQSERRKKIQYNQLMVESYFWRTHSKQEIDRIETMDESINAYEFKWMASKTKIPSEFKQAYPKAKFTTITKENYLDFIA